MLQRLFISNYALIEKADIELSDGFSVITGETGAGKSILLGAIGLILGERADYSTLKDKGNKCVIEAEFDIKHYNLNHFFESNDIDFDNISILRREINSSGKSRAFINDTPVKLTILKEFGEKLINIHSQNQSHQLNNEEFLIDLIDSYSNKPKTLSSYKVKLKEYKEKRKALDELSDTFKKLKLEEDYIKFQYEEIKSLNLSDISYEELKNEIELSENQEKITSVLESISHSLNEDQKGLIQQLNMISSEIISISEFSTSFKELSERIKSIKIELNDIQSEIQNQLEKSTLGSSSNERVSLYDEINRLLQKHFFIEFSQLLTYEQELSEKVDLSNNSDEKIKILEKEISSLEFDLNNLAEEINLERKKTSKVLEKEVGSLLESLVLPNATVNFGVTSSEDFKNNGKNKVQLLFNANLGGELKEISKSASGGETSRLMLAIQFLYSKKKSLSTLIFDEIDTGISGEIASKIGDLLKEISNNLQVISITHLPQVASKGTNHFKVSKEIKDDQTKTFVQKLSKEERITEIAKMLSGEELSSASIENAKSLLTS
jgi:DNA repair protein RecN (Recombination protein N)